LCIDAVTKRTYLFTITAPLLSHRIVSLQKGDVL
jgi:hypothetical protein